MKALLLLLALVGQGFDQGEAVFGPTNLYGLAGNGRLTAGFSSRGEITLLRWPNPSFYEHTAYMTALEGKAYLEPRMGALPNMGVLLGLSYVTSAPGFTWLRDDPWQTSLRYAGNASTVLVIDSDDPALGLHVEVRAVVPPGRDTLGMDVRMARDATSPVTSANLVLYENLGPTVEKADSTNLHDLGVKDYADLYEASRDALLHYAVEGGDLSEFDGLTSWTAPGALPAGSGCFFALGGGTPSLAHGVGMDASTPCPGGRVRSWPQPYPPDPFLDPAHLQGTSLALCQAAGALAWPLAFDALGEADVQIHLAAAAHADQALSLLDTARAEGVPAEIEAADEEGSALLGGVQLPPGISGEEQAFVQRTLLSIRQGMDAGGSIVASVSQQPPYFADWPRDGTFIDLLLDLAGKSDWVDTHEAFYVRTQRTSDNTLRPRIFLGPAPAGSWAMNYFADGTPFGPVNFEIDQTGLPLWGFWAHAQFLKGPARRDFLRSVWPTVARAADLLTACRDASTGLQCPSAEDDSFELTQGLQGATAVLMGLKSAVAIGRSLCAPESALRPWDRRAAELRQAILDHLYDAQGRHFEGAARGGSWMVFPLEILPPDDPRMTGHAAYLWSSIDANLARRTEGFSYLGEPLLALARLWGGDPGHAPDLRDAASILTTQVPYRGTLHQGEAVSIVNGAFVNRVGIPHLYEASLGSLDLYALYAPHRLDAVERFDARCEGCSCSTGGSGSLGGALPVVLLLVWLRRRSRLVPRARSI